MTTFYDYIVYIKFFTKCMLNLLLTFFPCFSWLHCYSTYSDNIPFRPAFKLSQLISYAHQTIIHIVWINLILVNFFQFFFCFIHIFLCLVVKTWISSPGVPCSKTTGRLKFDLEFHCSEACKMSIRNFRELCGKE